MPISIGRRYIYCAFTRQLDINKLESSLDRETFRKRFKSITAARNSWTLREEKNHQTAQRELNYILPTLIAPVNAEQMKITTGCSAAFPRKVLISLNLIQSYLLRFKQG